MIQNFDQTSIHRDAPGSLVYFPLIQVSGEIIGVFSAQSYLKHYFTEQHLNFLQTIVSFITSALSNANAYQEVARVSDELRGANDELHILNYDLESRNVELKALIDEKSEIMGIVAHDLKNPIGAVGGLVDILRTPEPDETTKTTILDQLSSVSNRMLELVKNVLDSYRMDDNSLIIHTVAMDVVPISEMVTDIFRDRAEAKNITLHFESAEREMTALADEQMYNQIIENILSNAIKYSPLGKNIFVRIALRDTVVRVEVQDEGPGISSEDMQKLFGKFARLSARPTGGEHSTGLGLNIVKKMVAAMHGKVWCESELGKGATFIVELPHDGK